MAWRLLRWIGPLGLFILALAWEAADEMVQIIDVAAVPRQDARGEKPYDAESIGRLPEK